MSSDTAQIPDCKQPPEWTKDKVRRFASDLTPREARRRKARDAANTAMNALHVTLEQLGPFVRLIPFPGLPLLVTSLSNVIAAAKKTTENTENLIILNQHLRLLLESVLRPLQNKRRISPSLEELFSMLVQSIAAASISAQKISSRGFFSRFINSADHSTEILQLTQEVNNALNRFMAGVLVAIGVGADEGRQDIGRGFQIMHDGIEAMEQKMENLTKNQVETLDNVKDVKTTVGEVHKGVGDLSARQGQMLDTMTSVETTIKVVHSDIKTLASGLNVPANDTAILNTLPKANARHDAYARRAASGCLPGTRVSVLSDVYKWMDNDDTSRPILYWLNGLGGIGKSTIAQTIAEREAALGRLGASFFFSRDVADRRQAKQFFPTLAYQLALFHPEFKVKITSAVTDNPTVVDASLIVQLQKLVIEPLCLVTSPPHTVTIVVDALDECSPGSDAETLLRLLASEVPRLSFRLQILITSRPEHHLRVGFHCEVVNPISQHFILHNMDESVVQKDIAQYLRHELSLAATRFSITQPWPSDVQVNELADRAGAFFIFAATAKRFITDESWANPKQQLKVLLDGESVDSSPYAAIDLLYHQIIAEALHQDPLCARFRRIVGPIVVLFDPLSAAGLEGLLQEEEGTVTATLSSLHSVLIVPLGDEKHEAIQIMHPSFPDYLTDPSRCTDARFCIEASQSHAALAKGCLLSLVSTVQRDMCGIEAKLQPNSNVEDLQALVEENISEGVRYACRQFGNHLQSAGGLDEDLWGLVTKFLQEKVLEWLEVLSLLGSVRDAIPNLRAVEDWLSDTHEGASDLLELVRDARRLVVMFYVPIRLCAAQVYQSAFLFMPNCRLRNIYQQKTPTTFDLLAGRDLSWTACTRVLEGHSSFIYCVGFSPDGTRVASASCDGTVRLYDAATGAVISVLPGQNGSDLEDNRMVDVHALAFSLNGRFIATGSDDGIVRVWQASTAVCKTSFAVHTSSVHSIAFSSQGTFAASSADKSIRLYDSTTYTPKAILSGHSHEIHSIAFSPDGNLLASGSVDQTVRLWKVQNAQESIPPLTGHSEDVYSVAFSHDGTRLASSSRDSTIRIWDGVLGIHLATLNLVSFAYAIAFAPDDTYRIVAGCADGTVEMWEGRESNRSVGRHSGPIYSVAFSADGITVASGATDEVVCMWDSSLHHPIARKSDSDPGSIFSLSKSGDGARLATCDSAGLVHLWDLTTGKVLNVLRGHEAGVYSVRFSLDLHGRHLASGAADATMILWDSNTGKAITKFSAPSSVLCVAFSRDGTRMGYGTRLNKAYLIDATDDQYTTIAVLVHLDSVFGSTFSPDSKVFATSSGGREIRLWNAESGDPIITLGDHPDEVLTLDYSEDGRYIAALMLRDIVLWDVVTYQRVDYAAGTRTDGGMETPAPKLDGAPLLGVVGGWVMHLPTGTRLLWLPLHFRPFMPECTVTHMGDVLSVATGTGTGEVIIISCKDPSFVRNI